MVGSLVESVTSEPCHRPVSRLRPVVDPDAGPLRLVESFEAGSKPLSPSCELVKDDLDILFVVALLDGAFVTPHGCEDRALLLQSQQEALALDPQHIPHMTGVFEPTKSSGLDVHGLSGHDRQF